MFSWPCHVPPRTSSAHLTVSHRISLYLAASRRISLHLRWQGLIFLIFALSLVEAFNLQPPPEAQLLGLQPFPGQVLEMQPAADFAEKPKPKKPKKVRKKKAKGADYSSVTVRRRRLATQEESRTRAPSLEHTSPNPLRHQPHPIKHQPHPLKHQPHPLEHQPHPIKHQPHPLKHQPHPLRHQPHPIKHQPHPLRHQPHPLKHTSPIS